MGASTNLENDRGHIEQRLKTHYAVTRALADSDRLRDAAPRILQAICESLGWEVGVLWRAEPEAKTLRCVEVWHAPGVEAAEFEDFSKRQPFTKGTGLPGHVWETGEPTWVTDMVNSTYLRAPFAEKEGLHGAFAFPVTMRGEIMGVLEFFSREVRELDEDVLNMLEAIGSQIGQFIERRAAEAKLIEQKELLARLNEERGRMIEEVSTPVVPVWRGVLILPIIGSLDTDRMQRATQAAMNEVMRTGAHSCIIDITGARIVDSHAVANLGNLVSALKLIGAEAIVTGVTAHVAHTLVGLGIDFRGIKTRRTLAEALAGIIKSQPQSYKDGFLTNGTSQELR